MASVVVHMHVSVGHRASHSHALNSLCLALQAKQPYQDDSHNRCEPTIIINIIIIIIIILPCRPVWRYDG